MSNKMSEWDRMRSGRLYNSTNFEISKYHIQGMSRCQKFNKVPVWMIGTQQRALKKLIPDCKGKNLWAFAPFYCEYGRNIYVGKDCFFNYNCIFLDISPITLEDNVWIGANVTLATPLHPYLAEERYNAQYPDGVHDLEYSKPITIKKNCWICSSATIIGGVTIGEGSIVAAGAVVTRDAPPNSIVAGVPARVIREIDENDRINVWETYVKNEMPLSKRDLEKNK